MVRILLIVFVLGLLGNLLYLDYSYLQNSQSKKESRQIHVTDTLLPSPVPSVLAPVPATAEKPSSCPQACLDAISSVPKTAAAAPAIAATLAFSPHEYYVPLGTGSIGGDKTGVWLDINSAQATIDTAHYPNITAAYFEVVMHLPTGVGEVKARLYDISTPYIFDGEQVKTTSSTGELLSHSFPIQAGSKNYKVQLTTSISAATLDSARIRLVTQ